MGGSRPRRLSGYEAGRLSRGILQLQDVDSEIIAAHSIGTDPLVPGYRPDRGGSVPLDSQKPMPNLVWPTFQSMLM